MVEYLYFMGYSVVKSVIIDPGVGSIGIHLVEIHYCGHRCSVTIRRHAISDHNGACPVRGTF